MVVVAMVMWRLRNPEWIRTLQETVGAFSQSRTFMGNDSGLFMTESETAILSPSTRTEGFRR